jgi:hypothetical protein
MLGSGIVLCPVYLDPFGRHGVWDLYARTALPSVAVSGLDSSN